MKKTIARLIIAAWVVFVLIVMTLTFIHNPLEALGIVVLVFFTLALVALAWALVEIFY